MRSLDGVKSPGTVPITVVPSTRPISSAARYASNGPVGSGRGLVVVGSNGEPVVVVADVAPGGLSTPVHAASTAAIRPTVATRRETVRGLWVLCDIFMGALLHESSISCQTPPQVW
jgi:hypothetical protein